MIKISQIAYPLFLYPYSFLVLHIAKVYTILLVEEAVRVPRQSPILPRGDTVTAAIRPSITLPRARVAVGPVAYSVNRRGYIDNRDTAQERAHTDRG